MKGLILALALFGLDAGAGELALFCREPALLGECQERVEASLEKMGCQIDKATAKCQYALIEDPRHPGKTIPSDTVYCTLVSENCAKPSVGNFGGEDCYEGSMTKIPSADRIHNGYWFGYWPFYSRSICIK